MLPAVFLLPFLLHCSDPAEPVSETPAAAEAPSKPSASGEKKTVFSSVRDQYEALRLALVADDISGAVALAAPLIASLKEAPAAHPQAAHWASILKAATELQQSLPEDPDGVREAFGSLSEAYVALLLEQGQLREGLHIFECPMAQGYPKWVQAVEALENPYMGQRMLQCGSSSSWSP